MSRTFEGFDEFVVARWPDLEGVAVVVTLDAAAARRVTTAALATLHQHWREARDEDRPGTIARRSVLSAAVAAASATARNPSPAASHAVPAASRPDAGALADGRGLPDDRDAVLVALEAVVRAAAPVERALVAAQSAWGAGPDEVADLLRLPVGDVRDRAAALRTRLLAAHNAARAAEGLDSAEWALDADLDAVLEYLLAAQGNPPDPAALVDERHHMVRRRSLVAAGAAVAVGGAATWSLLPRDPAASAGGASWSGASRVGLPSPSDANWESLSRWAPRGRIATDSRVQGLVIRRAAGGGHLVWADDVAGQRMVVSATLNLGREDVIVEVWHGAAGADPPSLQGVSIQNPFVSDSATVVAIAVPTSSGTLLVVLARPKVTTASYSPTVLPTGAGVIERAWTNVALQSGIGATTWVREPGPALRVRCADFDGPPLSPTWPRSGEGGTDGLAGYPVETRRFVAAATGLPVEQVRTEVVIDATVGAGVIDPIAVSAQDGDGRVCVLRTATSAGALIRCVRVAPGRRRILDGGRSTMNSLEIEPPAVFPADTPPDEPIVSRLADLRPGVGRFLVIAPGADRVQLLSASPNGHPASKVTPAHRGIAIVSVTYADEAPAFRLVRRDSSGRRFGTGVPRVGRDLLDL